MALNMDGATIGFDSRGLTKLVNDINIKCITETEYAMLNGTANLKESVKSCWAGTSADTFIDHMEADRDLVINAIKRAGDACIKTLEAAGRGMSDVDENMRF